MKHPFAAQAKIATTTTLGAAAGGLTSLALHARRPGNEATQPNLHFDVAEMCNGILAGLVSTTASCAVVEPWAAVVVGAVGAVAYAAGATVLVALKIDDAVNACPVHFFAGLWGLLAPALFARPENVRRAYDGANQGGLFYTGEVRMLACQSLAALSITAFVAAVVFPFFLLFKKLGYLRVPMDEEIDGLDEAKHGGSAYDIEPIDSSRHSNRDAIAERSASSGESVKSAITEPTP